MNGFITLDKKIIDWEWYKSSNERTVFIHLLLICNYKTKNWRGNKVKRGQLITSYQSLSNQIGISINSVRTAMSNLKSTGEITIKSTNQFSLVTICKYNDYQIDIYKDHTPINKPKHIQVDIQNDTPINIQVDTPINTNLNALSTQQNPASEIAEFVAPTFNEVRAYFHEMKLYESNPVNFYADVEMTHNWKQDAINYANGKR
ncbi:MAG: hypothetical protein IPN08_10010 [Bacteroidales bacterium]|nr:hypothetical protein [Bacteroidales bacterium]